MRCDLAGSASAMRLGAFTSLLIRPLLPFANVCIGSLMLVPTGPLAAQEQNAAPVVTIHTDGNRQFYWDGAALEYQVVVSDREQGDTIAGSIDRNRVAVRFDSLSAASPDWVPPAVNQEMLARLGRGRDLMASSNCAICHSIEGKRPMPTYVEIAERFQGQDAATEYLATKIVDGGSGAWITDGSALMPPHSKFTMDEARLMARTVLGYLDPEARKDWLAVRGSVIPRVDDKDPGRHLVLWAAYTDDGSQTAPAATAHAMLRLRPAELDLSRRVPDASLQETTTADGAAVLAAVRPRAVLQFESVDLTTVRSLELALSNDRDEWAGGRIEVRVGDLLSKPIATAEFAPTGPASSTAIQVLPIPPIAGVHDLIIHLRGLKGSKRGSIALSAVKLGQ